MASVKDNLLQLNAVIEQNNKQLDAHIKKLEAGAVAVAEYAKQVSKVPSDFQTKLSNVKSATDNVAKSTAQLTAVERERINVQRQLERTTAKLAVSSEQNTQALERQKAALRANGSAYLQLAQAEQKAARSVQDIIAKGKLASETQAQYNARLSQATREFEQLRARLIMADTATRRFNRNVGNYPQMFGGMAASLRQLMAAFGVMGGIYLFVGALRDAFNTIKAFDKANADLAATMGKSRSEITALTNDQKRLGASTKFTAVEVAGLQKEFAKLGFSQREILNATEATLALAAATDTDLARAAEVAGATLRGFGLDAAEMGRVTDVMAASFTQSALSMDNFAESMKYVAPIAGQTGVSIEFATAMLGKLADSGVKGSQAGTSLRRILTEMAKTGKPAAEAFRQVAKEGISVTDAMDEVGRTAQTALLVLSKNATAVNELAQSLNDAGGAAQKMADEQLNSLQGQLTLLSSAWDGFVLSLNDGEGVISKVATAIVQQLTKALEGLTYMLNSAETNFKSAMSELSKRKEAGMLVAIFEESKKLSDQILVLNTKIAKQQAIIDSGKGKGNAKLLEELKALEAKRDALQKNLDLENETLKQDAAFAIGDLQEEIDLRKENIKRLTRQKADLEETRKLYGASKKNAEAYLQTVKDLEKQEILLNTAIGEQNAYRSALNTLTKNATDITNTNTEATKKNKKEKEGLEQVETNSKVAFERNIKALEHQLSIIAKTSIEYGFLEFQIKLLKDAYEAMYGSQKKSTDLTYGTIPYYENEIRLLREKQNLVTDPEQYARLEQNVKYYQDLIDWIKGAKKETEELKNETEEWLKQYRRGIIDDFIGESGFSKIFFIIDNFDKLKESGIDTALAISEAFQEAFNTIAAASADNFDREYERLEQQRDTAVLFAGDSASAREEIDRQYEERKKQIQRREAEAQKRLAIFNIALNTAQGITAALASTPPNIPLSIAIGVIGAAQLALTASREIPQFWKGTDNAPEGWAWTQERGAEIIADSKGNIKDYGSNDGPKLTYLNKGDKVLTAEKTKNYLNSILALNGILPTGSYLSAPKNVNSGITKEDLNENFNNLAKIIRSKENINISIDKKGFKTSIGNKEITNNRLTGKSRTI